MKTAGRLTASMLAGTWWLVAHASPVHAAPPVAKEKPKSSEESLGEIEARKLFLDGRSLLDQGKAREACVLLARSHALAPTLSTLLNLGLCSRQCDRLATAHDYYRQAEVMATLMRDTQRGEFAHDEAAAIAAQRATLTLRISGPALDSLEVKIDGVSQARETWEHPMFIDAGEHIVSVTAAGEQTWDGAVVVADGGKHVVVIPEFEVKAARKPVAPSATLVPAPAPPPTPVPAAAISQAQPGEGLGTARWVAVSVGGAGVVALGVSLALTIVAGNTYSDSEALCSDTNVCSPEGVSLREKAHDQAVAATVLGISGGVALIGGAAVWLLADPSQAREQRAGLTFGASPDGVRAAWATQL